MLGKIKRKAAAKAMGVSDKQMAEMERMQRDLGQMQYRHEENGIVVKVSGDMKVQYIEIDGQENEDIKKAVNKSLEKMQREVQKKMMESGGLGGLLGR